MRWLFLGLGLVVGCATGGEGTTEEGDDSGSGNAGSGPSSGTGGNPGHGGSGPTSTSSSSSSAESSSSNSSSSAEASSSSSSAVSSSSTGGSTCTPIDLVNGGGFEDGPMGGAWVEASTNFGTPICDVASCGTGAGTGPNTGTYWSWFGGTNTALEEASVSQSIVIGVGTASLSFELEIPSCEDPFWAFDTFDVTIDGNTIFSTDNMDPSCGVVGYALETIDVSSYADGGSHTIAFTGVTDDYFEVTNFMVDDVQLIACP